MQGLKLRYKFVHDCCRFYWNNTVRVLPLPYCIIKYEYCKVLYVLYYRTYYDTYYYLLPATYYLLPILPTTYYLLPTTDYDTCYTYLLPTVPTTHYLLRYLLYLPTTYCTYYLLPATYYILYYCRTAGENGLHDGEGAMARGMDSYDAVYSYRGEREREP